MRTPDYVIMQGSTPTIEIVIPLDISGGGCVVYLDLVQNGEAVLEYTLNGTAWPVETRPSGTLVGDDWDGNLLRLNMTQDDTLRLKEGDVAIQLRLKSADNLTDTTIPVFGYVGAAYKQGVI